MLNHARNIRIRDISVNVIQQNTSNVNQFNCLDALHNQVATNAISNTGGRADDPKCQPGTREEVIELIEQWIDDADRFSRIFWLSGPAGAGKTAIVKTIADRCKSRGVHTANFFFFRGDSTRNLALPLVATLVYQILQLYPAVHDTVTGILSTNPLILRGGVSEQFDGLIYPLFDAISDLSSSNTRIIFLIDGLDECDIGANLDQARIIQALTSLATRQHSPFLVLIASRPEPHIQMSLNQLPSKIRSIFLDDKYSPQKDIRHFVNTEFQNIKASHPNARSLPPDWPLDSEVEDIVAKSSGQFMYPATVMRYIGQASTVPSLSLQRVKGIIPSGKNSPFTHLDSLYAFVLSRVDDIEITRHILGMGILKLGVARAKPSMLDLLQHVYSHYTENVIKSCVAQLFAVLRLSEYGNLVFYHASMKDFLLDQSRSGVHWIDTNAFREKALVACWKIDYTLIHILWNLETSTPAITRMLRTFPSWTSGSTLAIKSGILTEVYFLDAIHKLYYDANVKTYKRIVRRYIYASLSTNSLPNIDGIPYARGYLSRYSWWHKSLNLAHSKKWRKRVMEVLFNLS